MVPRRQFLRALGLSVAAGVAGCNALSSDDGTATDTPIETETSVVTPTATLTPTATSPGTPAGTPAQQSGTAALTATDGDRAGDFGTALALGDGVALVDRMGGRVDAFVSEGDGWRAASALRPDGAEQFNAFRPAVALAGETALVGATSAGTDGAVAAFERGDGTWDERTHLTPDDGESYVAFGTAVDADAERLAVGAVGRPEMDPETEGAVFVFERSQAGWSQQAVLRSEERDTFGRAVALDGDTLVVGAPGYENGGAAVGRAYVYVRSDGEWRQQARLAPGNDDSRDFGRRIALDGDALVVGALSPDGGGWATLFGRSDDQWQRRTAVPVADRGNEVVAVGSDHALVTAPGLAEVTVAERTDGAWRPARALVPADDRSGALFGYSLALSGSRALVGAPTVEDGRAGRVYGYDL